MRMPTYFSRRRPAPVSRGRWRTLRPFLAALVALVAFLGTTNSASASLTYQSSFGGEGGGGGEFRTPAGVAVNQATGDVYVVDRENNRIEQFTSSGAFIRAWGYDVVASGEDNSTSGNFEICKASPPSTDVCKAGKAGGGFGEFDSPRGIAVDNSAGGNGAVYVVDDRNFRVEKFSASGNPILEFGKRVDKTNGGDVCPVKKADLCGGGLQDFALTPGEFNGWPSALSFPELGNAIAVGHTGDVYVSDPRGEGTFEQRDEHRSRIELFDSAGDYLGQATIPVSVVSRTRSIAVAVNSAGRVFVSAGRPNSGLFSFESAMLTSEGTELSPEDSKTLDSGALPVQVATDLRDDTVWVSDENEFFGLGQRVCGETGTVRRAILVFDSEGNRFDCDAPAGPGELQEVTGLATGEAANLLYAATGSGNRVKIFAQPTRTVPVVSPPYAVNTTTTSTVLRDEIRPGFADTSVDFEYGPAPCSSNPCNRVPGEAVYGLDMATSKATLSGLSPDTEYYFRVVATNAQGPAVSVDGRFKTFAVEDLANDSCPNALARKQTGSAGLLDCRAYELASAEFAGGYDVESDLVPGQEPLPGYPGAPGRVLYSVHGGGIPGSGSPTNLGRDPYVATRGATGWSTEYVGIPSTNPYASGSFASPLLEADQGLSTFAFGGEDLCDPCFPDGSTNVPVHLPDGSLAEGMSGSLGPAPGGPEGFVQQPMSPDGRRLVFGSKKAFEPGANQGGSDLTLYERDLYAHNTEIISTLPNGSVIADGDEVGELALSSDGSRALIGTLLGEDEAGNKYWHLYMHLRGVPGSLDLTPTASKGVRFAGMTADGTVVYMETADSLLPEDADESVDIYRATVGASGQKTLELVSTRGGAPSNDETCQPVGQPTSWNAVAGNGRCNAVAFAGGAGVAASSASIYFLSPERLDGSKGEADQPNLYVSSPGEGPRFVATIDSSVGKPGPVTPHWAFEGTITDKRQNPSALAVDESTGDFYVAEPGTATIRRFDSHGNADKFTVGASSGTNTLTGFSWSNPSEVQIAVDNSGTSTDGTIYVTNGTTVAVFARTGQRVATLTGSGTFSGSFTSVCGVSTDGSGKLYVADKAGRIWQYSPSGSVVSDSDVSGGLKTAAGDTCGLASGGASVYMRHPSGLQVERFEATSFAPGDPPAGAGTVVATNSTAIAADPVSGKLFVDYGNLVKSFDETGAQVDEFGGGDLTQSTSLAFERKGNRVYASRLESEVVRFAYLDPPYAPIDNPAVVDAMLEGANYRYGDFQVSPDGSYAAFPSSRELVAGEPTNGAQQIYRYSTAGDSLSCASCPPTHALATSNAELPQFGLGLTDDGRVFFNTDEQLVLRDTNQQQDAYEWHGIPQLVSSGTSSSPSGMLTVTHDGTDAFFFTRDQLVQNDRNGATMKIYDARANGGFFVSAARQPCAASDECHGPGSEPPPPPPIGTFRGTGGQAESPVPCRKRHGKKHGKCGHRHKHHHRRHPKHHRRHRNGKGGHR